MIGFILTIDLAILCQEIPIIIIESMRDLMFEEYTGYVSGFEIVTGLESISQVILIITFGIYIKWSINSLELMADS